jgi:NAD(P)-dependent dehydrogenase (short-subunit alcohol dehydrogenase family)
LVAMTAAVLVVGATGVLRPAVFALARDGRTVYALARPGARLDELVRPHVEPVAVDYRDVGRLAAALPEVDAALLYCPAAPPTSVDVLLHSTDGPVVWLLTSASADPADVGVEFRFGARVAPNVTRVALGWAGGPRWHTPEEISTAALDALGDGTERVLGAVRPWEGRPQ